MATASSDLVLKAVGCSVRALFCVLPNGAELCKAKSLVSMKF